YQAKRCAGDVRVGLIEVGMVKNVEKLQADPEVARLVDGQVKVLHHREIGVEIVWTPNLIGSLVSPGVDSCSGRRVQSSELYSGVEARRVQRTSCADDRPFPQIVGEYGVPIRDGVVEAAESAARIVVIRCHGQSRAREHGPGNGPTSKRSLQASHFWRSPHITQAGVVANIVIGVAIVVSSEVERVLRVGSALVGSEVKRQETVVRDDRKGVTVGVISLKLQR